MPKIQKVIEKCNECEFSAKANLIHNNHDSLIVCLKPDTHPFILLQIDGRSVAHEIDIPKNCPLEDYKPKKQ